MTRLLSLFAFASHTLASHTQGVKRGDGGGRETQKEKTGEETAQQGTVLVCGNHHSHVGKTKQDMSCALCTQTTPWLSTKNTDCRECEQSGMDEGETNAL